MNIFKKILNLFSGFIAAILILFSLVFMGFSAFSGYKIIAKGGYESKLNETGNGNYNFLDFIPAATNAATGNLVELSGQKEGRINTLVLGRDPEGGLTDTIMILSYFVQEKKMVTVNIPRDFYVSNSDIVGEKINGIVTIMGSALGDDGTNDVAGIEYFVKFLQKEFDIIINYWASINVGGLRSVIDLIGGVEIDVQCSFTDYTFPADNYQGYISPAPVFTKGIMKMDGITASIYARSRYSQSCNEGSDFARSKRQSIVIQAALLKIKNANLTDNLFKVNDYLKILNQNFKTNMTNDEIVASAFLFKSFEPSQNYYKLIWETGNGFLCDSQSSAGSYIISYGIAGDCGYLYGGSMKSNIYKTKAQLFFKNMLKNGQISLNYQNSQNSTSIVKEVN